MPEEMPAKTPQPNHIEISLQQVLTTIRKLEKRYQRPKDSVRLLAVSKTKPIGDILLAHACGQIDFGENYLQEALKKIEDTKIEEIKVEKQKTSSSTKPTINWHYIGPIQKNKTRLISEHFQWVHSVDRALIAQRLNDQRPDSLPPLQICIQVNIDNETTKSGVTIDEIQGLVESISTFKHLKLRGLMAIPHASSDTEQQRKSFSKLRQQLEQLSLQGFKLDTLSMGMSGDLEAAIAEGATIVRVGTAIFGKRTK